MIAHRLVLPVVVFAVAACGGESDDDDVAQAIATDLRSEQAFADDLGDDEARCVGDAIVADLGVDDARALGRPSDQRTDEESEESFDFEALSDDDVGAIGSAMEDCVGDLDQIVVDLVAMGILDAPDEDFPITDAEATCVGGAVVDEVAFSRLLAIGLETSDDGDLGALSADEAVVFGAAFADCVDVRTILLDQVADSGAEPDVVECLDDQISDDAIQLLFIDTFAGNEASAEGAFEDAIDACT